jgi:hypothetical protein
VKKKETQGRDIHYDSDYSYISLHVPFYTSTTTYSSRNPTLHTPSSYSFPSPSLSSNSPPSVQSKEEESDFIDLCSDEDNIPVVIDGDDISFPVELIAQQR